MFGLGTWELVLIIVIALIFLGPDKLPEIAKVVGKGMRSMREAMSGIEREINTHKTSVRDYTDHLREDLQNIADFDDDENAPFDPSYHDDDHDEFGRYIGTQTEPEDNEGAENPEENDVVADGERVAADPFTPSASESAPDAESMSLDDKESSEEVDTQAGDGAASERIADGSTDTNSVDG
jgi:Tat protein translocase TatB subunit